MPTLFRRLSLSLVLATIFASSGLANATYQYQIFMPGLVGSVSGGGITPEEVSYNIGLAPYSFPQGEVGQSYNVSLASLLQISPTPTAQSYLDQVSWSVVGNLPPGLALTGALGEPAISGMPSTVNAGAQFDIVATYSGSNGQRTYTIVVGGATLNVTSISVGGSYACAVTTSGGAKCWGTGDSGQLGDGRAVNATTPVNVTGLTSGVASISAGRAHTCVVTTSGGAKCWGAGVWGTLGRGSEGSATTPVNVTGLTSGVAAISAGYYHTCAITTSGGAKCWGQGTDGQLGGGSTSDAWTPANVAGLSSGVTSISTGDYHTCAVTAAGGAKCWGRGTSGQLGNGNTASTTTPVDVTGLSSGVTSISTGDYHTCAVTAAGGAKCWGYGAYGQLGQGATATITTPVNVTGLTSGVASISAGNGHTCAITTSGGAKCWGNGADGRLGNGSTASVTTPVDVTGLTSGVTRISGGGRHTCAVTTSGGAKCWGYGHLGRLGNGSTTTSTTPVNVLHGS